MNTVIETDNQTSNSKFNKNYFFSKPLVAIYVFIISVIVYFLTTAPDLTFTDAGELAGVCTTLGIAHPTGYPLFTLLGYLWGLIMFPFSKIYALNLFAGVCTAISASVFFLVNSLVYEYILNRKDVKYKNVSKQKSKTKPEQKEKKILSSLSENQVRTIAFISALIYAFAQTVWEQATSIEVYSLQLMLVNLIIFTFLKAVLSKERNSQLFFLTAFLMGLGFSTHMQTLFLIPGILFLFFKRPDEKFNFSQERLKSFLLLLIPLIIGLSFYIYLPLRSSALPEFNWGGVSRNFDKFFYHIQGKQYQVWMFSGSEWWSVNFGKFMAALPYQLAWIGFIPLLLGFYFSFRYTKSIFWFLVIMILSCLFYSLNYSIHDIETYFLISFIGLLIFTGIGLLSISRYIKQIIPFLIIIPIISIVLNFKTNDESKNYLVPEYTKILVDNLRPNAVILSSQWDYWCSGFLYMQRVENYRPDVSLIEKELLRRTWFPLQLKKWYPALMEQSKSELADYLEDLEVFESGGNYDNVRIQERYVKLLNSFIDKNFGKRPIYLTLDVFQNDPEVGKAYLKIPEGFAFRLEKEQNAYIVSVDNLKVDKFISSLHGKSGHLVEGIRNVAAINIANIGRYALMTKQFATAEKAFEMSLRVEPNNEVALQGLQQLRK